jgi:superfamily II DNA/RNA helicase
VHRVNSPSPAAAGGPRAASPTKRTANNNGKNQASNSNSVQQPNSDRVWQSRVRSVEDLEATLEKRWGTNLAAFTAHDDWSDEDDDEKDDQGGASEPLFRAKPVADPWTVAPVKAGETSATKGTAGPTEYYDEDDEGYDASRSGGSLQHLIRPRPAGGSGQTKTAKATAAAEPSYFFRPPPEEVAVATPSATTSRSQRPASSSSPEKPKAAVPLLDERTGKPLLLSTVQADRFFHETTTADVSSIMKEENEALDDDEEEEEEDSPLAAVAARSKQTWADLGVDQGILLKNLQAMGCPGPLPVQQNACPDIATGRDVVIGTYTGSGKTLAFLVPLLQQLLASDAPTDELRILIVAPGRELASQIVSVARELCQGTSYTAQLAIGGTTFSRNLQTIRQRKPSILVGTPGRLAELIVGKPGEKRGRLKMQNLQTLVLDEFDALLEYKPHREPTAALVEKVQRHMPNLQSILCSATATDVLESTQFQRFVRSDYILALTDDDDVFVTADGRTRVSRTVMHGVVHVPHRRFVLETVRRILHTEPLPRQILMFVDNSRKVDRLVEKLGEMGVLAAPLHGGNQSEKMDRAEVSKALRDGQVGIVVATEMAARGLDAPLLTHVINVDLPTDASHYAHRAGRCGRGGRPGVVLNLTTDPKERKVPKKFAGRLGIDLYTVDVRNGRLNVVDPDSVDLDDL